MAIHYKKRPWNEVIDPTFNKIIKKYMETLRLVNIPANEGHLVLSLPEESLKKIEREGYPKFGKFYEKEDMKDIFEESKLLFSEELKDIDFKSMKKEAKKRGVHFQDFIRFLILCSKLIKRYEDCDYYLKSFKPFESEESFNKHFAGMNKKERKKCVRKFSSDILSMFLHVAVSDIDELKKENEYTQRLRINVLNSSKLIRRLLFSIWDSVCLINHKKSLKQLFCEAHEGNDESLFRLFQYDPTLFDQEWVRVRIRKALYSGDTKFFDDLAETLKKGCLDTRKDNLDITIVLMNFWKAGIYRLTTGQKMELLSDSGIKIAQSEASFRKIVDRIRPFVDW